MASHNAAATFFLNLFQCFLLILASTWRTSPACTCNPNQFQSFLLMFWVLIQSTNKCWTVSFAWPSHKQQLETSTVTCSLSNLSFVGNLPWTTNHVINICFGWAIAFQMSSVFASLFWSNYSIITTCNRVIIIKSEFVSPLFIPFLRVFFQEIEFFQTPATVMWSFVCPYVWVSFHIYAMNPFHPKWSFILHQLP